MPATHSYTDRFDKLAHEASRYVFDFMVGEKAEFVEDVTLVGGEPGAKELFPGINEMASGYFTIAVGYDGDARGRIMMTLSKSLAEKFALKLLDATSLDWLGEDPRETLIDIMGELGNSTVGLIKGGLTKLFPNLMLTTPKVACSARFRVDESALTFRKQYHFRVMGSALLVDFCHR